VLRLAESDTVIAHQQTEMGESGEIVLSIEADYARITQIEPRII
jgi:hypothetical protein